MISKLSPKDCQRFQHWEVFCSESNEYEEIDAFAYGFRFGALLMNAVFASGETPPNPGVPAPKNK